MTFLRLCDLSQKPAHVPSELAQEQKFPLDIFQEHAISAIDQGHNVLVCAKTGSGKTLVGEQQIAHSLKQGKRVFQTTPIKSLSNQKFHDLKQMWPAPGDVGIMTGDIKFCPDARIIVMTTEILRNLLQKRGTSTEHIGLTASLSLNDLGAVVFDECHQINDRDRGKVWEETMILLPQSVQLIMLSATLDHPEFFAEWIGELKQTPCHLIQTQHRVVPLTHSVFLGEKLATIMGPNEVFQDGVQGEWLRGRESAEKEHEAQQKKVAAARRAGTEGAIGGKVKSVSFGNRLNTCIRMLHEKGLLPALAFVLSRKGCELWASRTESDLLDSSDSCAAERIFDFHLRHHKESLETLPQQHAIRRLIVKGIAFHHSGVLPVLKEVVEILFTKGYIKLLYCTETFAVGINMPTKTVIFTGLEKYDDATQGMRFLRTDEQIQMAGRAGRRGKDTMGQVIYLPERDPPSVQDMRMILKGGRPQIESRMNFHQDFLLKVLQAKETRWIDIQEKSQWQRQKMIHTEAERELLKGLREKAEGLKLEPEMEEAFAEKEVLEERIRTTANAKRREAQRLLERWKDTHIGPKWALAEQRQKSQINLGKEIASSETTLCALESNQGNVETWMRILQKAGFLTEEQTLTPKGILATEMNECHAILCAEFVEQGLHKNLAADELLCVLACQMEEKETGPTLSELNVSEAVREALRGMDSLAQKFQKMEDAEKIGSPEEFWTLSTTWVEPVKRWLEGDSAAQICSDAGLFEGNFVRAILRVANMVDEWIAVATLREDLETLEKLQDVRPRLVRDFIVPDSLYLHL